MHISRRRCVELVLAAGGAVLAAPLPDLFAKAPLRPETPNMVLGPFYPIVKPDDRDRDLTIVRGHAKRASGEVIEVHGRVLNRQGQPVRNAHVEIWQTNRYGRYSHPSDPNVSAPLDPDFQGFGMLNTGDDGTFSFTTIKPAAYPSPSGEYIRAAHIHFDVQGHVDRKITQMFFPNDPLLAQDRLYQGVRGAREMLISRIAAPGRVQWDIVLAAG